MRLQDFAPPASDEPVEWALAYARSADMAVFPVGSSKKPLVEHGLKDATTDEAAIRRWWARWRYAGIAWALPADVVVLDLDVRTRSDGARDFVAQEGRSADNVTTPQASTPRGGRHLFYSADGAAFKNGVRLNGLAIDLRTIGGYVVLPAPGVGREWLKPLSTPLAPVPQWIVRPANVQQRPPALTGPCAFPAGTPLARYVTDTSLRAIAKRVERAIEGERNNVTYWAACRFAELTRAGLVEETWAVELLALAASRAGLPDIEARSTIASGFNNGRG
jgi:hypothetical protein